MFSILHGDYVHCLSLNTALGPYIGLSRAELMTLSTTSPTTAPTPTEFQNHSFRNSRGKWVEKPGFGNYKFSAQRVQFVIIEIPWVSSQISLGVQTASPNLFLSQTPEDHLNLFGCADNFTQHFSDPHPCSLWMSRRCRHPRRVVVIFCRHAWTQTQALGMLQDSFSY